MNYYEVHCTNCGKILTADRMAVNLDEFIKEHLKRVALKSSNAFYREASEIFDEIRIGMYLTKSEMLNERIIDYEDSIELSVEKVKEFIEKTYRVTFPQKAAAEEEETEDSFWKEFSEYAGEDEESAKGEKGSEESFIDELGFKLAFYREIDNDEQKKRAYLHKILDLFREYPQELLLKCSCEFLTQTDDRGQDFISALRVTYVDNEVVAYNHMVCPQCGEAFFVDAGRYEEKIIVMLGSSRVGKTAYLAALVEEINPLYGQSKYPNIVIRDTVDKRYVNFKNNILEAYRRGKKITKTDESKGEVALFPLEIVINGATIIFYFVDLPGEVFVPRDERERENGAASGRFIINHRKICYCADAFWLCIDPVQIDIRLHNANDSAEMTDRVEMDMDMVLSNIENMVNMMGTGKTKVPTAIVITKSDLISAEEKLYSCGRNIGADCLLENRQFRLDIFNAIADKVKRYLLSDNVKNLVPKLEKIFDYKNFFSVAAYGRNVESRDEESMKMPYGISLPFLWTITCMEYLQPVRFVSKIEKKGFLHRQEVVRQSYEPGERDDLFVK